MPILLCMCRYFAVIKLSIRNARQTVILRLSAIIKLASQINNRTTVQNIGRYKC